MCAPRVGQYLIYIFLARGRGRVCGRVGVGKLARVVIHLLILRNVGLLHESHGARVLDVGECFECGAALALCFQCEP